MKKADFYANEFLAGLVSRAGTEQASRLGKTLAAVQALKARWQEILTQSVGDEKVAAALARVAAPSHVEDGVLFVSASQSDEQVLIHFYSQAIVEAANKLLPEHAQVLSGITQVKPARRG